MRTWPAKALLACSGSRKLATSAHHPPCRGARRSSCDRADGMLPRDPSGLRAVFDACQRADADLRSGGVPSSRCRQPARAVLRRLGADRPRRRLSVTDGVMGSDGSADGPSHAVRAARRERGLGAATNAARELASGALIAYLPSDDVWFSEHLEPWCRASTPTRAVSFALDPLRRASPATDRWSAGHRHSRSWAASCRVLRSRWLVPLLAGLSSVGRSWRSAVGRGWWTIRR